MELILALVTVAVFLVILVRGPHDFRLFLLTAFGAIGFVALFALVLVI